MHDVCCRGKNSLTELIFTEHVRRDALPRWSYGYATYGYASTYATNNTLHD